MSVTEPVEIAGTVPVSIVGPVTATWTPSGTQDVRIADQRQTRPRC